MIAPSPQKLLVILGPTASGKTSLAVRLARRYGAEVWSADSRQVYRGLDIGSGKDLAAYREGGPDVIHHMIDIADPAEEFSVFYFQKMFFEAMEALARQPEPRLAILAGGTGLYLEAALRGERLPEVPVNDALRQKMAALSDAQLGEALRQVQPRQHNQTDLGDRARLLRAMEIALHARTHPPEAGPALATLILGVAWERSALRERIARRLRQRLQAGLLEEVESLHRRGLAWERLESLGLEYRYAARYLQGTIADPDVLYETLFHKIADLAKRQMTWFRRMERQGFVIHWIPGGAWEAAEGLVASWLGRRA